MPGLHASDTEIIDYGGRRSVDRGSRTEASPAKRQSKNSLRRKPAPVTDEEAQMESIEPTTGTDSDATAAPAAAAAPAAESPNRGSGFLSYFGFGNGRERPPSPLVPALKDEPALPSSDALGKSGEGTTTESSDYVDYTTAAENGRRGGAAPRTGMFGATREPLTTTDEEEARDQVFSDDGGYAGAPSYGRQRGSSFGKGRSRPPPPMSESDGYTESDVPVRAYDPMAPRPARNDPTEGESAAILHISPTYPELTTTSRIMLEVAQFSSFLVTAMAFNGLVIYAISLYIFHNISPFYKFPPRAKIDKAWERRITGERFSARTEYYIEFWGYDCEVHDVETEDGFILRLFRIVSRKNIRRRGKPVLINHGLLSNSATWVMTEEKSLPFMLAERGYDVWLGNIRTNYNMPHRKYAKHDPQYHSWAYREIALYDVPAQIEYIFSKTGRKIRYCGHSQGAVFLALSNRMRPDIGDKIECFAACAPAIYAGTALYKFPLSILRRFTSRPVWQLVFGKRTFYPIINLSQQFLPAWLFGHISVPVFHALFGFHPHNWAPRQIPKFFRSVPVGNSSELLYFYLANFAHNDCVFDVTVKEPWFNSAMPRLAIFYGELDTLVKGAPLVDRIREHEPHVNLELAKALPTYEHQDFLWSATAPEDIYEDMIRFFEKDTEKVKDEPDFDKESKRSSKFAKSDRSPPSKSEPGYAGSPRNSMRKSERGFAV